MPYNPAYPIDFTLEGDETHVAIYKLIQEIDRIYTLLNELDDKKEDK